MSCSARQNQQPDAMVSSSAGSGPWTTIWPVTIWVGTMLAESGFPFRAPISAMGSWIARPIFRWSLPAGMCMRNSRGRWPRGPAVLCLWSWETTGTSAEWRKQSSRGPDAKPRCSCSCPVLDWAAPTLMRMADRWTATPWPGWSRAICPRHCICWAGQGNRCPAGAAVTGDAWKLTPQSPDCGTCSKTSSPHSPTTSWPSRTPRSRRRFSRSATARNMVTHWPSPSSTFKRASWACTWLH